MADAATDALVASRYPEDWARANSKLRTKLRKRYREDCKLDELRAAGRSCATCKHFELLPFVSLVHKHMCSLTSDFYGQVVAQKHELCTDWKDKTNG